MPLQKLVFKPGINRENTDYANEGGWYSCDKVRFRSGQPQKIGGWSRYSSANLSGIPTSLTAWRAVNGDKHLAVGTSTHFYIEEADTFYNVTPVIDTLSADNPFEFTTGSNEVVVHLSSHGLVEGQQFDVANVAAPVQGISAAELNGAHVVTTVDDSNTFRFEVTSNATGTTSYPPGEGGAGIDFSIVLPEGAATGAGGTGWGAGPWSRGAWSSVYTSALVTQLRVWSVDTYGEDLFFCNRDGYVCYWDKTSGVSTRAVTLDTLASDCPVTAKVVLVSPADRRLFAFGCNGTGASTQDPLLVRWSSSESITDWTPSATNSAGELRITRGNQIVAAHRTKQEILVWTDEALYSLQMIGVPEYYGLQPLTDNITIAAPNAVATVNNVTFWMGRDKFYVYAGAVDTLPCTLLRHVFGDINLSQAFKFFAGTNESFSEIWWFYCSASSSDIDRYVVFNYLEKIWYYGTMARGAWLDSSVFNYPLATCLNGCIYNHEFGVDDGTTSPAAPIEAYIESSIFDLGEGDRYMFVRRLIPDVSFAGSTSSSPVLTMTITPRNYPGEEARGGAAVDVRRSTEVPIEQYTREKWIRVRGRHASLRVASSEVGVQWQVGAPRLELQPDGGRA